MTLVYADRVQQTTQTEGTITYSLDATIPDGEQSILAAVGDGNTFYYTVEDGDNWEVGLGTIHAGTPNTVERTTILKSSQSDSSVNWGVGTRNIFLGLPADVANSIFSEVVGFVVNLSSPNGRTFTRRSIAAGDGIGVVNGDGQSGSPTITSTSRVLNRDVTARSVDNTVTETSIYSFSVPASTLGTDKKLRLTVFGEIRNSFGAATFAVRGKYGATTFSTFSSLSNAVEATGRAIKMVFEIAAFNSANAQIGVGELNVGANGGFGGSATGFGAVGHTIKTDMAEDSALSKTLEVTVQHDTADPSIEFISSGAILELV